MKKHTKDLSFLEFFCIPIDYGISQSFYSRLYSRDPGIQNVDKLHVKIPLYKPLERLSNWEVLTVDKIDLSSAHLKILASHFELTSK